MSLFLARRASALSYSQAPFSSGVSIGDPNFLAFKPNCVAIVDAVVTWTRGTNSERGSNQKHVSTLT